MGDVINNVVNGRIVKGIAGFYYVSVCLADTNSNVYECHAKGSFRKEKIKPIVGDYVSIEILDEEKKLGSIIAIEDRKNELIRPLASNVDQAVIVFAFTKPEPNLNLLDKFLIMMRMNNIDTIILFNKEDLAKNLEEDSKRYLDAYKGSGAKIMTISALNNEGIDDVKKLLSGKTTILAGPSGVGKSTLINAICENSVMETGSISEKLKRGKHTTRHSEIFAVNSLGDNSYIMDTPGFTAFELVEGIDKDEIKDYYPEFFKYEGNCKYEPCSHTHEPSCAVKTAVSEVEISQIRYDNYLYIYDEIKNRRVYK